MFILLWSALRRTGGNNNVVNGGGVSHFLAANLAKWMAVAIVWREWRLSEWGRWSLSPALSSNFEKKIKTHPGIIWQLTLLPSKTVFYCYMCQFSLLEKRAEVGVWCPRCHFARNRQFGTGSEVSEEEEEEGKTQKKRARAGTTKFGGERRVRDDGSTS